MAGTLYLGFRINSEEYGVPISRVRTVIRYEKITPIHESSEFLKGVINLRGKIIPIIDMRRKFGMEEQEYNDRTIFIILDVENDKGGMFNIGIAVDAVSDVVELTDEQIEKTLEMGLKLRQNYLFGIAQVNGRLMMLLNIARILNSDEITDIRAIDDEETKEVTQPANAPV